MQTIVPRWRVKDVAAHLLDSQVRKLSAARQRSSPGISKPMAPQEFVALIDSLNAEGVRRFSQLSPDELISKMETASKESAELGLHILNMISIVG